MEKSSIEDIVLAITYRCNSRCRMCNIWKNEEGGNLKAEDLKYLPSDLRDINISGGEPFLKEDLVEIIKVASDKCKKANIIISTNGFATDLILEQTEKILKIKPELGISVSLDGVGVAHDEIRGIPGGYEKALKTIEGLKKIGVKHLKIAFTLGDYNASELPKVYKLSKELHTEFTMAVVHSSEIFFGKENKIGDKTEMVEALNWLTRKELSGWNLKRWARAYFTYGLREFLKTGKRILPDYSGKVNIFVDPFGNIYPCDVSSKKIGVLKDFVSLNFKEVDNNSCDFSWMVCTARPAIKKHWFKAGTWVLKEKAKYQLVKLKNNCLYVLGLVMAILNRARRLITGYGHPRPIADKKIFENINYDYAVVSNFKEKLKSVLGDNFSFKNKKVLEIGPGPDLGAGLFIMGEEAKSYTAIDRFKLIINNKNFYDQLINFAQDKKILVNKIKEIAEGLKNFLGEKNKDFILPDFKYLNLSAEDIPSASGEKYDLIISQAVLEHVDNPESVFGRMYELLDEQGVMCHEIDFKTHTAFIRDIDPLNILRYGGRVYKKIKFKGSPNRLRINDYKKIAENAGFKNIFIIPLKKLDFKNILEVKDSLAWPFSNYTNEDLEILSAVLIAQK